MKRWSTIAVCQHEWTDYYDSGNCPGAEGCTWHEQHCRKCGIYSRNCGCGFEAGLAREPRQKEIRRGARSTFQAAMRAAR